MKACAVLLMVLVAAAASGKTLYVATYGNNGAAGTADAPLRDIQAGLGRMSGGDTLIIRPGTYQEDLVDPPSGTTGGYSVVRAELDGTVTIEGILGIDTTTSYVQIEGLKFTGVHESKGVGGHHVKILRCAFVGGPSVGNNFNFALGSDDFEYTNHVLIEDSWFYGEGGRYNVLIYNSEQVVLRRVVIRHDGGWDDQGTKNPEAAVNIYNSGDVQLQNVLVLDNNIPFDTWEANFYNVANGSSSHGHDNTWIRGGIVYNSDGPAVMYEGGGLITNANVVDSAFMNSWIGVATNNGNITVDVRNVDVIGNTKGFAEWGGNSDMTVRNSIIYDCEGEAYDNVSSRTHNVCFGNDNDAFECTGTDSVLEPTENGLKYLTRVEAGSALSTMGDTGGRVGARVMRRIGVSGTHYGEPGYDTLSTEALWPWPNEVRLKRDLCSVTDRGLCATGRSLTEYIWEALGNAAPGAVVAEISIPRPPPVVRLQSAN